MCSIRCWLPVLCLAVSEFRPRKDNLTPVQGAARAWEGKGGLDLCFGRVEEEGEEDSSGGAPGNPVERLCFWDEGESTGEKKETKAWNWTVTDWYTTEEYSRFQATPVSIHCKITLYSSVCAHFLRGNAVVRIRARENNAPSSLYLTARRLVEYCHPTCHTCENELSTGCLSCRADGWLTGLNTCICAAGYYPAPSAASCSPCHPTCATCTDSGKEYCQSCHSHATLLANTCSCDSGYGWNAGLCALCATSCLTCHLAGNANSCKSCGSGQSLASSPPSNCLCSSGLYPVSPTVCASCNSECATCIGPASIDCISCFGYANLVGIAPHSCICWSGYAGLPNACVKCADSCVTCSVGMDPAACTSCVSPAALTSPGFPSACACPPSTFLHPVTGNCVSCPISCVECTGDSPYTCTVCGPNAYLESGFSPDRCVCPGGVTSPPNCPSCLPMCRLCDGSGCTACFPNAELMGVSCVCGSGFYGNAEDCKMCDSACLTCSGPSSNQCLTCKSKAQSDGNGGCVCMDRFFSTPDSCQPCPSSICLSCSDSNTCSICAPNSTLSSSLCTCNSHFFPNSSTGTCDVCDASCQQCDRAGANGCTQCWHTAALTGVGVGTCNCPSGNYFDLTGKQCFACYTARCVRCSGPGEFECQVCVGYLNANACLPCDGTCTATCTGSGPADCVSCDSSCAICATGLIPDPCVCAPGSYMSTGSCASCPSSCSECSIAGVCSACPPNSVASGGLCICRNNTESPPNCLSSCHLTCATCSGTLENQCLSCYSPAAPSSGKCTCPSHTFPDPTVTHCSSCDNACLECVGPASSDCSTCPNGFVRSGTGYKSSCDQIPCHPTCNGCDSVATPNQCTACHSDTDPVTASSTCVCKAGFYPDGQSFRCVACPDVCTACSLSIICTACVDANASPQKAGSEKICRCNTGFYPNTTASNCSLCHPTCLKCSESLDTNCISCPANSSLSSTKACVCNAGFYRDGICKACHATCYNCITYSDTQCTACKANARLTSAASCVCKDGYYPAPDASNCPVCPIPCAKCNSPTVCTLCKSNATVSGLVCACLNGFYPNSSTWSCQPCDSRCLTCRAGTFRDCLSCKPNSSLVFLTAIKQRCDCDVHYFYNSNDLCTSCHPSCYNCLSGLETHCLECYPRAYLLDSLIPSLCVCMEGLYPMPYTSNCVPCEFTCFHCAGPLASDCLDCLDFAELAGPVSPNYCQCVSNAFPNPDSAHCTLCQQECSSCIDDNASRCTGCWPGAFLHHVPPSDCLCNPGSYPSPNASNCEPCSSSCLTCERAFECLSCKPKALLVGVECVCESRYFPAPDAGNCQACGSNCKLCDLAGCLMCDDWYFLYLKECVLACPDEFKSDPEGSFCLSKDLNPPVPSLSVSPSNNLLLSFNTNITSTLSSTDLDIAITQPSSIYIEVLWSNPSFVSPDSLQVDLMLQSSALENNSYVVLTFLYPNKIRNLDGAEMTVESLNAELNPYGEVESNTTTTLVQTQTTTTGQSSAAVAATASILAGSPTSFLAMINNIQLLTYIPLSKIPIPKRFAAALAGMNMKEVMSNPIPLPLPWNYSGFQPADAIVEYGIETTLFLPNVIWIFATWTVVLAGYLGVFAGTRTGWKVLALYCRLLLKSLVWEVPLLLYFASYLDLGIFSSFQLLYSSSLSQHPYILLNYASAIAAFSCFFSVPLLLIHWEWQHYRQLTERNDPQFLQRWTVLIQPFQQTGKVPSVAYYCIFLLRRLTLGLTLVLGRDYPVLFGLTNTAICITSLIYTLLWRPFHLKMDQFDAIWAEAAITLTYLLASSFLIDLNSSISSLFDEIGVWTVRSTMILSGVSSIIRIFLTVYHMLKLYVRARHSVHDSHAAFHRAVTVNRLSFRHKIEH